MREKENAYERWNDRVNEGAIRVRRVGLRVKRTAPSYAMLLR